MMWSYGSGWEMAIATSKAGAAASTTRQQGIAMLMCSHAPDLAGKPICSTPQHEPHTCHWFTRNFTVLTGSDSPSSMRAVSIAGMPAATAFLRKSTYLATPSPPAGTSRNEVCLKPSCWFTNGHMFAPAST